MIKTLIKVALVLIVAVIGYNYFLGDAEEKASSRKIVNEVKDLGKSMGGVIKSEAEKFREGKLNRVMAKMNAVMSNLDAQSTDNPELRKDLKELIKERESIQGELNKISAEDDTGKAERKEIAKKIDALEKKFNQLIKDNDITILED